MAFECKAWRASSDSSLHNSAADAAKHDLKQLRLKLAAGMSKVDQLEDRLAEHADEIIAVLTDYRKYHPAAAKKSEGIDSSDGKKGPTKRDPQKPRTLAEIRAANAGDKFRGHEPNCKARALNQLHLCDCTMSKISFCKTVPMYEDELVKGL